MRSKVSAARALFRIISAQASSSSSSNATATASASTTTASVTSASRLSRSIPSTRRRRSVTQPSAAASLASSPSSSPSTSKSSPSHIKIESKDVKTGKGHQTIFINANLSMKDKMPKQSTVSGLNPVHPPKTSLSSVATQAFFALDRPLLEHVVMSPSSSKNPSHQSSSAQLTEEQEENNNAWLKNIIANAHEAIMETASQASRLSQEELSRTTFVIGGSLNSMNENDNPQRVTSIKYDRFAELIDNLAKSRSGLKAVYREAKALEEEANLEQDIEKAVAEAIERGEDVSAARKLGSESDLVVLGEPDGPNPKWPRGVATYLTEETRALEPPEANSQESAAEEDESLEQTMKLLNVEELAKAFAGEESTYTVRKVTEKDPNLLLSHALVQAILPPRLKWDQIQAKMDEAAGTISRISEQPIYDISTLNADEIPQSNVAAKAEGDDVKLDSVKRKRRKKMNKHKYKKFRKATRTERNRLKK